MYQVFEAREGATVFGNIVNHLLKPRFRPRLTNYFYAKEQTLKLEELSSDVATDFNCHGLFLSPDLSNRVVYDRGSDTEPRKLHQMTLSCCGLWSAGTTAKEAV